MTENSIVHFPEISKTKLHKENDKKFGKPVMDYGFTMVPALLPRAQRRLGLSATEFAVIIQLLDYWWYNNNPPRPSQKELASRLGMEVRSLQRHLKALEVAGYITVLRRSHPGHNGNQPNAYRLDGLVKKLKELEPEFTQERENSKRRKSNLELPAHQKVPVASGG